MNTLGYDFNDTWISINGLSFALRLGTTENIYAPLNAAVTQGKNCVSYQASALSWAGGQKTAEGEMALTVACDGRGVLSVTGFAQHAEERGRSLVVLVRGLKLRRLIGESENMPATEVGEYRHSEAFSWPGRTATMPLVML
ncbi:MAG: hypothetical protein ABIK64_07385, partial [Bacillota bacterium]